MFSDGGGAKGCWKPVERPLVTSPATYLLKLPGPSSPNPWVWDNWHPL